MKLFKSAMMNRMFISKSLGFIIGLIAFISIPYFLGNIDLNLRLGILFWYTTMGVIIGIFGVMDKHPSMKFKISAWVRGTIMGAWLNFVLVLFVYDKFIILVQGTVMDSISPFWIIAEGAIIGLIIDLVATKCAGEGKKLLK